jgi:hypothetical protein
MRNINTIYTLPPQIIQHFNSMLLSVPTPKFCDDSYALWSTYQYIKRCLQRKIRQCDTGKDREFLQLEMEFLDLYARITQKENEYKEKTGTEFQRPFGYFKGPDKRYKRVYGEIRKRTRRNMSI